MYLFVKENIRKYYYIVYREKNFWYNLESSLEKI